MKRNSLSKKKKTMRVNYKAMIKAFESNVAAMKNEFLEFHYYMS